MKKQNKYLIIILIAISVGCSIKPVSNNNCNCDRDLTESIVKSKDFNRLPKYDDTLTGRGFYNLPYDDNKALWFREVETPEKTKFTHLWNEYVPNHYIASQHSFIKYYKDKKGIELAFQFGPKDELWAYHVFVFRKIGCCYLATKSFFSHARFHDKLYAIIDKAKMDSLYSILAEQKTSNIEVIESYDNCGYFADNRNNKCFYINFIQDQIVETLWKDTSNTQFKAPDIQTQRIRPEIEKLFDFVDNQIIWNVTYSH